MLEQALFEFLRADSAVLSLVGQGEWARIFPHIIPQKESALTQVPCIVYAVTGEERQRTRCGTDGLTLATVQLDCYALTVAGARDVSRAARDALMDYRGAFGGIVARDVSLEGSAALYDLDPGLMRVVDTYNIWFDEE